MVGPDQIAAWNEYKKFRNNINNRKKSEEIMYKKGKMTETFDSPDIVWKTAKSFMGWKSTGTPTQLKVDNQLVTSAKKIAQLMNEFFLNKYENIRASMPTAFFDTSKIHSIMNNKTCKLNFKHIDVLKVKKLF